MTQAHRMTDLDATLAFLTGGRATFTVVSQLTGNRFTFRLRLSKDERVKFASVRQGASYDYIGWYRTGEFGLGARSSAKSKLPADSLEMKALNYTLRSLAAGHMPNFMEFWHEGKCGCCGRPLTDPVSIARGIGPDCWVRYVRPTLRKEAA